MSDISGEIVKITSIGTISITKQFRRHLEMQKGDHIMIDVKDDHLVVRKVQIS